MREFIGHKMKVLAENFPGPVEGVMVDEKPNMILLKGNDGGITRVVKSHISGFMPMDFEPSDYVPFIVLACECEKAGCPGVQYVVEGEGFKKSDFEAFMGPCPCRTADCRFGSKGELRSVGGTFLGRMLTGAMFGEYPKKEIRNASSNNGKAGVKTGSSSKTSNKTGTAASKSRGVSAGRSGASEEGAGGQAEM